MEESPNAAAGEARVAAGRSVMATLTMAVWLAIVLGLVVQLLILFAKVTAGGKVTGLQLVADVASGVTWSALVCSGVAVGTVA